MFAMPILLQIECDAVQPLLPYYTIKVLAVCFITVSKDVKTMKTM